RRDEIVLGRKSLFVAVDRLYRRADFGPTASAAEPEKKTGAKLRKVVMAGEHAAAMRPRHAGAPDEAIDGAAGVQDGSRVLRVSIVVVSHNYAAYIAEAVESALAQTFPCTEVVVVDDGSTDASRDILKTFGQRIRLILKDRGGETSAVNAGFAASLGDI